MVPAGIGHQEYSMQREGFVIPAQKPRIPSLAFINFIHSQELRKSRLKDVSLEEAKKGLRVKYDCIRVLIFSSGDCWAVSIKIIMCLGIFFSA